MENEQFEIFHKILEKLNDSGSLNELILIGSWCLPIYSKINCNWLGTFNSRTSRLAIPRFANLQRVSKIMAKNSFKDG